MGVITNARKTVVAATNGKQPGNPSDEQIRSLAAFTYVEACDVIQEMLLRRLKEPYIFGLACAHRTLMIVKQLLIFGSPNFLNFCITSELHSLWTELQCKAFVCESEEEKVVVGKIQDSANEIYNLLRPENIPALNGRRDIEETFRNLLSSSAVPLEPKMSLSRAARRDSRSGTPVHDVTASSSIGLTGSNNLRGILKRPPTPAHAKQTPSTRHSNAGPTTIPYELNAFKGSLSPSRPNVNGDLEINARLHHSAEEGPFSDPDELTRPATVASRSQVLTEPEKRSSVPPRPPNHFSSASPTSKHSSAPPRPSNNHSSVPPHRYKTSRMPQKRTQVLQDVSSQSPEKDGLRSRPHEPHPSFPTGSEHISVHSHGGSQVSSNSKARQRLEHSLLRVFDWLRQQSPTGQDLAPKIIDRILETLEAVQHSPNPVDSINEYGESNSGWSRMAQAGWKLKPDTLPSMLIASVSIPSEAPPNHSVASGSKSQEPAKKPPAINSSSTTSANRPMSDRPRPTVDNTKSSVFIEPHSTKAMQNLGSHDSIGKPVENPSSPNAQERQRPEDVRHIKKSFHQLQNAAGGVGLPEKSRTARNHEAGRKIVASVESQPRVLDAQTFMSREDDDDKRVLNRQTKHHSVLSRQSSLEDMMAEVKILKRTTVQYGCFSEVWECQISDGEKVASAIMKVIRRFGDVTAVNLEKRIASHVSTWVELEHDNLLPFYGSNRVAGAKGPELSMVFAVTPLGNVLEYLKRQIKPHVTEILRGIAAGLEYMHLRQLVHGGLKAANVMISDDGKPQLADSGFSIVYDELLVDAGFQPSPLGDSVRWSAPELLSEDPNEAKRSPKSDVFAFASTALELMTYEAPFHDLPSHMVLQRIKTGQNPPRPELDAKWSPCDELWALMVKCWKMKRQQRPTITEVRTKLSEFYSYSPDELELNEQLERQGASSKGHHTSAWTGT